MVTLSQKTVRSPYNQTKITQALDRRKNVKQQIKHSRNSRCCIYSAAGQKFMQPCYRILI